MRGGAFLSGSAFALVARLLDGQLRFQAVERHRSDVLGQSVVQRLPIRLRLLGRGRKPRVADLEILERDQALVLVHQRVRREIDDAEDGRLLAAGFHCNRGMRLEREAVPGVELRLVDREGLSIAGQDPRPARVGWSGSRMPIRRCCRRWRSRGSSVAAGCEWQQALEQRAERGLDLGRSGLCLDRRGRKRRSRLSRAQRPPLRLPRESGQAQEAPRAMRA